jgi:FdhD protein
MNSKYKVIKFKKNKFEKIDDLISIEEPLEISIKYKDQNEWLTNSLSITMRTPGHDEDLVRGFLYNEQIIQNLNEIDNIESLVIKLDNIKFKTKY